MDLCEFLTSLVVVSITFLIFVRFKRMIHVCYLIMCPSFNSVFVVLKSSFRLGSSIMSNNFIKTFRLLLTLFLWGRGFSYYSCVKFSHPQTSFPFHYPIPASCFFLHSINKNRIHRPSIHK